MSKFQICVEVFKRFKQRKWSETHVMQAQALPICVNHNWLNGKLPSYLFFHFYAFWHHAYFRANTLLEKFCESFGASHFYTNLWLCLNSNPSVRLSGTCYLLAHINKLHSMEDQLYLLGADLGLLVSVGTQMIAQTSFL